jgi:hypothetical protein
MDQGTLVSEMIDDGKLLLVRFAEEGVPVTAAFWLKESDGGGWYLYLVTPLVPADGGTLAAYRRVGEVVRKMPQPFWVDGFAIKVIGEHEPIAKDALAILRQAGGARSMRWNGASLGRRSIEGAYFYPLPVAAS